MIKSYEELIEKYGTPSLEQAEQAAFSDKWLTLWKADEWERRFSKPWTVPFCRMYVNRDLIDALDNTFFFLDFCGVISELKTFDGCYCVRDIRGKPGKWSIHSWGLAVDLNAAENPLGGPVTFSRKFLEIWRLCGWTVGADFDRQDGMHMQLCSAF